MYRRARWLINIRRDDLTLDTIGQKNVCSAHFEPSAYYNSVDWPNVPLLTTAAPTIIDCPNPPKLIAAKRKPPAARSEITPARKRKPTTSEPIIYIFVDHEEDNSEDPTTTMKETIKEVSTEIENLKKLLYYYNTRIFFEIKLSNLNLKLKKKGSELNKDKKINL